MIPAFPANNQWAWFQRITQEVSRRCWLCFYLFYAVTLALLLGGVFITLFSGHPPFALVMTMIVTSIVVFILIGLMYLCEANKVSAFIQEKFSRRRIAQDPYKALEMEKTNGCHLTVISS